MKPLSSIRLFLTDVDGCLTDGGMYYSANGDELKKFSVYDGLGMVLLKQNGKQNGIRCGIITGETTPIVERRAAKLQLEYLFMGCKGPAKVEAAQQICAEMGITLKDVCYVGDDIIDIDLLQAVGLAACPPNARPEVKAIPGIMHLTTPGGEGAVREIADIILKALHE